jgi:hypothetical protein
MMRCFSTAVLARQNQHDSEREQNLFNNTKENLTEGDLGTDGKTILKWILLDCEDVN